MVSVGGKRWKDCPLVDRNTREAMLQLADSGRNPGCSEFRSGIIENPAWHIAQKSAFQCTKHRGECCNSNWWPDRQHRVRTERK